MAMPPAWHAGTSTASGRSEWLPEGSQAAPGEGGAWSGAARGAEDRGSRGSGRRWTEGARACRDQHSER